MRKASVVFTAAVPTIAVAALVIAGLDVRPLRAGDHFDSPSVLKDGRTDIGDVYIFPAATDCVDGNDGEFSTSFPYLAAAH